MSFLVRKLKLSKCSYDFQVWQGFVLASQKKHCHTESKENPPKANSKKFRTLRVLPPLKQPKKEVQPEAERFPDIDVDSYEWSDVWVGPKSFDPYMVPLPLKQGYVEKGEPPGKYANAELMKIPNFLHLTPPAVEKHCKALRKFCTNWPKNLATEEQMNELFPINIIATDYCNSLPTIRDPLARIITLKVKLSVFKFDKHAKDKFLRLVGERYDPKTGYVTITVENCPLKKQNYDYAMYLLTALYYESWKVEDWESSKSEEDMEEYIYKNRKAKTVVDSYFAYNNKEAPEAENLEKVVEKWINAEDSDLVKSYKDEALNLLQLQQFNKGKI